MTDNDSLHSPAKIEKMNEFFEARVDGYEEHLLETTKGCQGCFWF